MASQTGGKSEKIRESRMTSVWKSMQCPGRRGLLQDTSKKTSGKMFKENSDSSKDARQQTVSNRSGSVFKILCFCQKCPINFKSRTKLGS
ncbi:hypothetical protein XENOCAPTIV_007110 [Xenoophorus captivus]|uniref:Uncharacterized protein n=1 Tax=Xenoophorus captivus TaxID=1517983 RepID=A0ABV0Q8P0_9TELE